MLRSTSRALGPLLLIVGISLVLLVQYISNIGHFVGSPQAFATNSKKDHLYNTHVQQQNVTHSRTTGSIIEKMNLTLNRSWKGLNESLAPGEWIHLFHNRIDNIRLLGERHSGTTYLTKYLQACFPKVPVKDALVRGKHWFQPSPETILQAANKYDKATLLANTEIKFDLHCKNWWDISQDPNPASVFRTSLVLILVRDPYQWLEAMRLRPWHWPNHLSIFPKNETSLATKSYNATTNSGGKHVRRQRSLLTNVNTQHQQHQHGTDNMRKTTLDIQNTPKGIRFGDRLPGPVQIQKSFVDYVPLDWQTFVSRPMRLLDEAVLSNDSEFLCQKGYPHGSISPCLQNHSYVPSSLHNIPRSFLRNLPLAVNDVVYELDHDNTGRPFDHPLQLRAAKIRNWIGLVHNWDLGGLAILKYEDVLGGAKITNNNATNLAALIQKLENVTGVTATCPDHKVLTKADYGLPADFVQWLDTHVDWEAEWLVGYSRASDRET